MVIPYGEWSLLILTAAAWAENLPSRRQLSILCLAWLAGKMLEGYSWLGGIWHVEYSRLAVMLVFFIWSWRRASPKVFAFAVPSVILLVEELLIANEPGTVSTENWFFAAAVFLTAWLTAQSFWGMACSVAGSILIGQLFDLFAFGGILQYKDLPDPFLWNFGAAGLALIALATQVKAYFQTRRAKKPGGLKEQDVLPAAEIDNPESERLI